MIRVIIIFLAMAFALPAFAQTRHALVIGIDDYAHVTPLQKARNDARAVADALKPADFEVTLLIDSGLEPLINGVERFVRTIQPGDEVLFFFAGHGVELDGQNFLLPADLRVPEVGGRLFLRQNALAVDMIQEMIADRRPQTTLVILDACRDNPFPPGPDRSLGTTRGLARQSSSAGSFVLMSADAGEAALDRLSDRDTDPNSVFTRALLPRLTRPGATIRSIAPEVRSDVVRTAESVGRTQFPHWDDRLNSDFVFQQPLGGAEAQTVTQPLDPCAAARATWQVIADSDNEQVYDQFIQDHPQCPTLLAYARQRMQSLQAQIASAQSARPQLTSTFASGLACERMADRELIDFERLRSYAREAVVTCREALSDQPEDAPTMARLARALTAADENEEAYELYHKAAALGDTMAMNGLAIAYQEGRGTDKDESEALRWFRMAAESGDLWAQTNLGWRYETGRGVGQDHAEAVRWYRLAADAGHARAQTNLGWMLANGRGTDRNDSEAVYWYHKAAEIEYPRAIRLLGFMFENGRGVEKDEAKAVRLARQAAALGDDVAMYNMGQYFRSGIGITADPSKAIRWYEQAAEKGNTSAIWQLATAYRTGNGIEEDYSKSVEWYRRGVELGHAGSMNTLGWMMERGLGVPEVNLAEAVRLYREAADLGNATAMANLGEMYANGRGVDQSHEEAAGWYRAAADAGNALGMRRVGLAYEYGEGLPQDDEAAASWYRKAAEAGDTYGMSNLAGMYARGLGVEQNFANAAQWHTKAAEAGLAFGMRRLGQLYARDDTELTNPREAAKWLLAAAEAGDQPAMADIGGVYWSYGADETGLSPEIVFKWTLEASRGGHAMSMSNVAWMYLEGEGTQKDDQSGMKWMLKAEQNGNDNFSSNLSYWSNSRLRIAQTILRDEGFYTGAIDGAFGPASMAALRQYVAAGE